VSDVSIRSRLFGREKLARAGQRPMKFQSAPTVSIRSRLFGREKPSASQLAIPPRGANPLVKFQSAPGFSAGRNYRRAQVPQHIGYVSIRSRLFGREKPTETQYANLHVTVVSIRSRLFGREKHKRPRPSRPRERSMRVRFWLWGGFLFQSAPGFSAGRNSRQTPKLDASAPNVFQSAPGFSAGRNQPKKPHGRRRKPFQSAPGFSAGRNREHPRSGLFGREPRRSAFQSAPGFSAGRNGRPGTRFQSAARTLEEGFQSAPGFSAGRNCPGRASPHTAPRFNPLPAFRPGETLCRCFAMGSSIGFNPLPAFRPGETPAARRVSIRSRLFGPATH
jgi:hypothetical protein